MAYISKEQVQEKRKQINALCKQYGVMATVSGVNTTSVTVTIRKGKIDFLSNHVKTVKALSYADSISDGISVVRQQLGFMECNHYCLDRQFSGNSLDFLNKVLSILKTGHYDNSNVMVNCFEIAWYIHICIGNYEKPYVFVTE